MEGLSKPWHIASIGDYVILVLSLSLLIRLIHSCITGVYYSHIEKIKALEAKRTTYTDWTEASYLAFQGFSTNQNIVKPNYWHQYIIGTGELIAYPILIATQSYAGIGAWIGLKTLALWKKWTDNREIFNIFLIGNLLTLAFSLSLTKYVSVGLH